MSDQPNESLLEIDDLHVTFATKGRFRAAVAARAVDGVDLTVGHREVVALVGESGCGKTTLLRAVMGLAPVTSGRIVYRGEDVPTARRQLRRYRRNVQVIFQDPAAALNPRLTVGEVVREGLRIHRIPDPDDAVVLAALADAGLRPPERFMDRYPHELSGGQRQRVVIAGAMVMKPDLLLADEPVASLDASVRGEILALMRSLVDETGVSILAVTHDLGLAWNIADRVAVMYLGRIVEEGPTEEILCDPRHPYSRALLSVLPETAGIEPQILTGETPDPRQIPPGCRFHPRCPYLASGRAEADGIEQRCRSEVPRMLHVDGGSVACHAVEVAGRRRTDG